MRKARSSDPETSEETALANRIPDLSIVVPAYNEQEVIVEFHNRLNAVLNELPMSAEIIYVDDGSTDATAHLLRQLQSQHSNVALLALSRNFGKEIALTAGLDHASGKAVVVIDADLQDPPEVIPELVRAWAEGYDVVYAKRLTRDGETVTKKTTARAFYGLMNMLGGKVRLPKDTGDFRLMSRRALDAVLQLREQHRFMKGLFSWIGFRQTAVAYHRDPRFAGATKWNYWQLWNLSIEGITSFTTAPLKIATYVGLATALLAFSYGAYIIYKTLAFGDPVAGFPSLMTMVTFLGGVQLMTLGIIGEYLGRVFTETKNRPLYFVQEFIPTSALSSSLTTASETHDDDKDDS